MKTIDQIKITSNAVSRAGFAVRTAMASLVLATAAIPVLAGNVSGSASKEDPDAIRPFHAKVPDAALVELRHRLAATRWPDRETVSDSSQGAELGKIQPLVEYWGASYNWRNAEQRNFARPSDRCALPRRTKSAKL